MDDNWMIQAGDVLHSFLTLHIYIRFRIIYLLKNVIFISCIKYQRVIVEGSLEVKLPTIWTDEKAEVRREEKESEKRRERVRRVRRERVRREEKESEERVRRKSQVGKKVEKSQITVFFK